MRRNQANGITADGCDVQRPLNVNNKKGLDFHFHRKSNIIFPFSGLLKSLPNKEFMSSNNDIA
jgi:hypothetical protein